MFYKYDVLTTKHALPKTTVAAAWALSKWRHGARKPPPHRVRILHLSSHLHLVRTPAYRAYDPDAPSRAKQHIISHQSTNFKSKGK